MVSWLTVYTRTQRQCCYDTASQVPPSKTAAVESSSSGSHRQLRRRWRSRWVAVETLLLLLLDRAASGERRAAVAMSVASQDRDAGTAATVAPPLLVYEAK